MTFYRKGIWFIKGLREYTKSGYERASKGFCESDLKVDCSGYHYMITGANSGIGKCVATEIARRGGVVYMVCRNEKAANEAKTEIINETGNEKVFVHILDLSHSSEVAKFTKSFIENHDQLNVLVNNAGCMVNQREFTDDGLEKNFATNTLGTHILTTELIPLLLKSAEPRVVIVSSGGMLLQKLNKDDIQCESLNPFEGTVAYSQNKRQQVVMNEQYSKRYLGIHFSSMHPGWAATPAVKSSMPEFYEKMKDKLRTPEQGADTVIWLSISKTALEKDSGLFYQDRQAVVTHLPLAWTRASSEEEEKFMEAIDELAKKYST